ncbi:MAG TPA: peptidylprolyl isomerase [Bacteroidales bacterium]|jgi:peptidyl-prolyl cis-trans isomerase A (cyclophilin A)|nr:MAG: Peptidyl-prolyl cis-trans isomerase A precursor [Bacteroidetes bacterium ADurb.BinA012]HNV66088.1 peptidylprolyl isomerase [Bacteroidales bacterium]HNY58670.1 peptidylprolyl isomerase [Bacteroidales bacterium]HOH15943.1 peptidylprolyl isomerase [Bacteroidales bacterium]HOT16938.1 peptidylprolyl isomerase [Bacteroidales bacterium]
MNKVRNIIFLLITSAIMALSSCDGKKEVIINTGFGEIHVALDLQNAPVTSANFLRYVDAGLFDSACFYRVVRTDNQQNDSIRIAVIQGGRYNQEETGGFPPIAHETTEMTGIRHLNGTISMARWTPGTATSEFFICVGDQPELDYGAKRNPDGQGFAAFGQVTKGMDVVMKIHSIEAPAQYLDKPILIYSIKRK